MNAKFEQHTPYEAVITLTPEKGVEDLLLAAWLRYDKNVIHASVKRYDNGRIETIQTFLLNESICVRI